jgi:hypothetical protein
MEMETIGKMEEDRKAVAQRKEHEDGAGMGELGLRELRAAGERGRLWRRLARTGSTAGALRRRCQQPQTDGPTSPHTGTRTSQPRANG